MHTHLRAHKYTHRWLCRTSEQLQQLLSFFRMPKVNFLGLCSYVCLCVYLYIYIYMCICKYRYTYIIMQKYIKIYTCVCVYLHIYVCIYISAYICIFCVYICVYTPFFHVCMCMHTCMSVSLRYAWMRECETGACHMSVRCVFVQRGGSVWVWDVGERAIDTTPVSILWHRMWECDAHPCLSHTHIDIQDKQVSRVLYIHVIVLYVHTHTHTLVYPHEYIHEGIP